MDFNDIIYEKTEGIARVTINRPERYNAFTALALEEMYSAFRDAWADKEIGVVVLTGIGEKAFCTGGDQKTKDGDGYGKGATVFGLLDAHGQVINIIRAIPKPVIAMVNGYAIGGGTSCRLSAISALPRKPLYSGRPVPGSAVLMRDTAQFFWPVSSVKRKPGKSGISAGSIPQRKPWQWDL